MSDWIQFEKGDRKEDFDHTVSILEGGGFEYKINTAKKQKIDAGIVGEVSAPKAFLYVQNSDLEKVNDLFETEYLAAPIPEDHFLYDASNDDVLEIIANQHEWNLFEIAHAKRIAKERGISVEELQKAREEALEKHRKGKPVSIYLVVMGVVFSGCGAIFALTAGIVGTCIGHWIAFSTHKIDESQFHNYDAKSRKIGRILLGLGIVSIVCNLILKLAYLEDQ